MKQQHKQPSWLQTKIAQLRYGKPSEKLRVIVVAGRAGKTTTAHLIWHLLREAGEETTLLTHHMKSSVWAEYGTNISTLQKALSHGVQNNHSYAIIEADAHLLKTLQGSTFQIDTVVALSDEPYVRALLESDIQFAVVAHGMQATHLDAHRVMSFGEQPEADMRIEATRLYKKGTEITLRVDHHNTLEIATHLVGSTNALNVAAALATMYVLSVDTQHFADGVAELEGVPDNHMLLDTSTLYDVFADRGYVDERIPHTISDIKKLARRRLIIVSDDIPSDPALEAYLKHADRIIVHGECNHVRITPAQSIDEAIALALRTARQGDTIVFIGAPFVARNERGIPYVQEFFTP